MSRPRRDDYRQAKDWEAALAAWAESPEGQAAAVELAQRRADERRDAEQERVQAAREQIDAVGIPLKDVRLIRNGLLVETGATRALAGPVEYALIVLSGNTGCGKTTAASAWIMGGQNGTPAEGSLFVKAAALARWDCYDTEQMDRLLNAPKLVIDDLGVEYMDAKGRFLSVLTEVIDVRYDAGRPTVITTGCTATEFKGRYRERIADRIREVGVFRVLGDDSMRGSAR